MERRGTVQCRRSPSGGCFVRLGCAHRRSDLASARRPGGAAEPRAAQRSAPRPPHSLTRGPAAHDHERQVAPALLGRQVRQARVLNHLAAATRAPAFAQAGRAESVCQPQGRKGQVCRRQHARMAAAGTPARRSPSAPSSRTATEDAPDAHAQAVGVLHALPYRTGRAGRSRRARSEGRGRQGRAQQGARRRHLMGRPCYPSMPA